MKLICSKTHPPLSGIITACYLNISKKTEISIEWSDETIVQNDVQKISCQTSNDVQRVLARLFADEQLYGMSPIEKTEVDHWLTFSIGLSTSRNEFTSLLDQLDTTLGPVTFLTAKRLTIADFAVFGALYVNKQWQEMVTKNSTPSNVFRWFSFIQSQEATSKALSTLPKDVITALTTSQSSRQSVERSTTGNRAREGKFVELPGAEMGKVVVRFPPEASGYLHIGHAKAALLNQYYQQAFQGKLIMRFDDTNPAKENVDFEKVILEDVEMLEIKPDLFTHTSQYFDLMIEYCEKLIKEGKAYVDDTDAELMKQQREQKIESANRGNAVEKNLKLWKGMIDGSEHGQKCCVRAKIDMQSLNGCMRDPTIYRCKNEAHPRTGTKYKVYPTYDFACPIVDAIEGVTHTLRTMEYHDRDAQFYWFIDALGLRKPYIWEYSRLSMMNTVLSKRKLTWFVSEGIVDGWDDPRMPTVRGVLRRGMTVEGLKEFIIAQGSSRSVVFMEWDKIWAFNKKVIDPIAPRYTSVDADEPVTVLVKGVKEECLTVPKHPKNAEVGNKSVWIGPKILIDRVDAQAIKEGENVTFINWGNLMVKKVNWENGKIVNIEAEPNLDNKDYKKTVKLTFLADTEKAAFTPTYCVFFDHLISKKLLGKDEDFKQFVNRNTRREIKMLGDPELKNLKKGDIIQLQRRGFFRVDVAYQPPSLHTCKEQGVILFYIPDGHTKEAPVGAASATTTKSGTVAAVPKQTPVVPLAQEKTPASLNNAIINQGDIVRNLKTQKATKSDIDSAVKILLSLKADYKNLANVEWKPGCVPPATESVVASDADKTPSVMNEEIIKQGNIVRDLKTQKADKKQIDDAVKALLALKADYKKLTNTEWKPGCLPPTTALVASDADKTPSVMNEEIIKQGNIVRDLKTQKADKKQIDDAVKALLALKADYKKLTNTEWKPGCLPPTTAVVALDAEKTPSAMNEEIIKQGNIVRELKTQKADKKQIDGAVKTLLALKADYKMLTNSEWKPGCSPAANMSICDGSGDMGPQLDVSGSQNDRTPLSVHEEIVKHGDLVRNLKAQKAAKNEIDSAVKVLLSLKGDYKSLTGTEWKPGCVPPTDSAALKSPQQITSAASKSKEKGIKVLDANPTSLNEEIIKQGNIVRDLKAKKAPKDQIDAAVKALLSLKADYKKITNTEWKPGCTPPAPAQAESKEALATSGTPTVSAVSLNEEITKQGNTVRDLKAQKAPKDRIDAAVKVLLSLKADYKNMTNTDWKPGCTPPVETCVRPQAAPVSKKSPPPEPKPTSVKKKTPPPEDKDKEKSGVKKQTRLGLEAKKEENISDWYSQIITKSDMIEYYDVSGCYILRPWSLSIWNAIQSWLDTEIKKLGVENCYFPLFVSKHALEKEKEHIADFSPEVAWVTKSGESDMAEPIAIRPTSETVMYPAYAKWIQSYRDLPIKLNQWNNVVRWEFKHPQPFLRTREFLWQEGHTAFADEAEAVEEVATILDLYARIYEELLAIPVVKGKKTEKEKFAGGVYTLTTEALISASGRAIQGATSHHLGQNFSKMFDIVYEDPKTKEKKFVYQNSWGITTRTIGVLIMVHADNQGLVLPPKVASVQVVIVPCGITASLSEEAEKQLLASCEALENDVRKVGIKVRGDYRSCYSPGWKFNHWELKGVPIRIELGPKDIQKNQLVAVRRDTGEKIVIERADAVQKLSQLLDDIQKHLFNKAKKDLDSHVVLLTNWSQFTPNLDKKNLILTPFCGESACEDKIKADSTRDDADLEPGAPSMGAKSLCIPTEQPAAIKSTDKCIHPACARPPRFYTLFGRSY